MQFTDTIAAIATAQGNGAVSLIRISGSDANSIASALLCKDLSEVAGYSIVYGTVKENGEPVDEVLVSVFHAPHSYTGEEVIELSCHGGMYITRKILALIYGHGARPARRGEFTERAYLNGKMDLAQAEGVNDLISARDEVNATSAVHSLKGSVRALLEPLKEQIVQIISNIEVNIDYPEYDDVKQLTDEEILPQARAWLVKLHRLIYVAQQAVWIRSGIDTVIIGRPNVGKSSLLNALLEEEKAIVTDIAGTTRDLVEGSVRLGDVTLNLIDTAGIRDADNVVEQIGIERSMKALEQAQLILLVLDSNEGITEEDQALLDLTKGRNRIIVYNKNDLSKVPGTISISAANQDVEQLKQAIEKKYAEEIASAEMDTLNNERQIGLAKKAEKSMQDVIAALERGVELDLVTIDLTNAYDALMEITGESSREGLLDEIFSRFCLGK